MVAHRKPSVVAQSKSRRKEIVIGKEDALSMLTSAVWYVLKAGVQVAVANDDDGLRILVQGAKHQSNEQEFQFVPI